MPTRSVSRVGGRRNNKQNLRIKLAQTTELATSGPAPDSSNNLPAYFWEQPSVVEERAPLGPRQVHVPPAQQVGGGRCGGLPPPPRQLSITVSCPPQQQRPPWPREEAVAPQLPPGVLPWARPVAAPPLVPPGFLPTPAAAPPLVPPGFLPVAAPAATHGSSIQQQPQRPPQEAGKQRRNPVVLRQKPVLVAARLPPKAPDQYKAVSALPPLPIQPGQRVAQPTVAAAAGGCLLCVALPMFWTVLG